MYKKKLKIKENSHKFIIKERAKYASLTLEQRELRLLGVDIEIVGVATANEVEDLNSRDRHYMSALHFFDENNKYIWKRVNSSLDKMTYNQALETAINIAKDLIEKKSIFIDRKESF